MKKKSTARNRSVRQEPLGIFKASLFGACIGLFCSVALLISSALICLFSNDPDRLIAPLAFISTVAVYFISGFAAVRKRRAALPCGALCGGMMSAVFLLISFFISRDASMGLPLPVSMLIRISFIAVSIIGALLGTNVGVKKPRRRK